jgi:hypothetical protein
LFVEELTKTILELGLLTDAGDRYETQERAEGVSDAPEKCRLVGSGPNCG